MLIKKRVLALVALSTILSASAGGASALESTEPPQNLANTVAPYDEEVDRLVAFPGTVDWPSAIDLALAYDGEVVALRYENPEIIGEYYFDSGVAPDAFLAEFQMMFGTSPAVIGMVVRAEIPEEESMEYSLLHGEEISSGFATPAYIPPPAQFSAEIQELVDHPADSQVESNQFRSASSGDWRPTQADYFLTSYDPTRVMIASSYWWINGDSPVLTPNGFGIEFEVNMYSRIAGVGNRPDCWGAPGSPGRDWAYKSRAAAVNERYNWRVIRPNGQSASSNLGASRISMTTPIHVTGLPSPSVFAIQRTSHTSMEPTV